MELPQKLDVRLQHRRLRRLLRHLVVAHDSRSIGEGFPVDLRKYVPKEIVIDLDLLLRHFLHLDLQRETVGYPFDVRRQHVVS